VLIDGEVAGTWRVEKTAGSATLTVESWATPSPAARTGLEAEGARLLDLVAPKAADHDVRITGP
jgi:hypothetical protein